MKTALLLYVFLSSLFFAANFWLVPLEAPTGSFRVLLAKLIHYACR